MVQSVNHSLASSTHAVSGLVQQQEGGSHRQDTAHMQHKPAYKSTAISMIGLILQDPLTRTHSNVTQSYLPHVDVRVLHVRFHEPNTHVYIFG